MRTADSDTKPKSDAFKRIDRPTFIGALVLLLGVTLPLLIWSREGAVFVAAAKTMMTDVLGGIYLLIGLGALFFMVFIIFSDIGNIRLGEADEAPEFSTGSWAAMLFCGGIGASILYWAPIEWAYYFQKPPFQLEPGGKEAILWSATYGPFHWGPIAWAIYLVPAVPIAYFFHVRRKPVLKISLALMPVLGETQAGRWPGKLIDVLFVFGLIGGGATSLGLAAPLINEGLSTLTGLPKTVGTQLAVLAACTVIFGYSAYAGLEKGIKILSNINFWGVLGLLAFIFAAGPTVFMFETGLEALGRMLSNFFEMAAWTEAFAGLASFTDTRFPQQWTVFYWAWWLVFSPSMGLFIARISRGRTIKQMVVGSLFFGSMGCFLFFMVLGNYGIYLQLTEALDVVALLDAGGGPEAVYAILGTLPLAGLVIFAFTLLAVIFTATTFDSISYILAAVVQSDVSEEPMRWNRLFWAFALSVLPMTLLLIGGLESLQTAAIVGGIPLIVISVMLAASALRAAGFDLRQHPDYQDPVINIEELSGIDPWSDEGLALARFERAKAKAQEATQSQRDAVEALQKVPLITDDAVDEDARARRAALEQAVLEANEAKLDASRAAGLAWEDFSLAMKKLSRAQARQRATTLPPE
ncbi:MAG: BCCT family transporter [Kiloniellales bacterium]|nr:BCCT family transporter [Kiloniellales bacterium]